MKPGQSYPEVTSGKQSSPRRHNSLSPTAGDPRNHEDTHPPTLPTSCLDEQLTAGAVGAHPAALVVLVRSQQSPGTPTLPLQLGDSPRPPLSDAKPGLPGALCFNPGPGVICLVACCCWIPLRQSLETLDLYQDEPRAAACSNICVSSPAKQPATLTIPPIKTGSPSQKYDVEGVRVTGIPIFCSLHKIRGWVHHL